MSNEPTFEDSVRATFEGKENVRPESIAAALQLQDAKGLRNYLRSTFTRPVELKGSSWFLTNDEAMQTVEHFLARRKRTTNETSA